MNLRFQDAIHSGLEPSKSDQNSKSPLPVADKLMKSAKQGMKYPPLSHTVSSAEVHCVHQQNWNHSSQKAQEVRDFQEIQSIRSRPKCPKPESRFGHSRSIVTEMI
jgi:hypothetical protein